MRHIHGTVAALLVCGHLAIPSTARAGQQDRSDVQPRTPLLAAPAFDAAAQASSPQKRPSPGGRLLKSTLIGAGIGAALVGILARGMGDCGDCSADVASAMGSGALYGGLIGAALGARPLRGPHPSSRTTVGSTVTPRLKMVSMAVRF